ncbi:MAG: hypothetical protein EXQ92_02715 [Alphaproteobacteria bacterium]|nr:hypothetical protein [Alphaproteobacteria bacterium]
MTAPASGYENIWSQLDQVLAALERDLDGAPADAEKSDTDFFYLFSRMLRYSPLTKPYFEKYGQPKDWAKFFRVVKTKGDDQRHQKELIILGQKVMLPHHPHSLVYRDLISTTLLAHSSDDTDAFIEFGAGWSANIFNLWKNGGPLDATYVGCEPTLAGRKLAERLARRQTRRCYQAAEFDYRRPDFTTIPADCCRPLIYTCHSIEQVRTLDPRFFDHLIESTARAKSVTGVHIEPIAWQYGLDTKHFPTTPPWAIRGQQEAMWRHQNENLHTVLDDAAARGIIRVKSIKLHSISSIKNYPTATIVWTRV